VPSTGDILLVIAAALFLAGVVYFVWHADGLRPELKEVRRKYATLSQRYDELTALVDNVRSLARKSSDVDPVSATIMDEIGNYDRRQEQRVIANEKE
jgi:hypothetical protein